MSKVSSSIAISSIAALAALSVCAQEGLEFPELVSPEEEAARELARRRQAPPVLSVEPKSLELRLEEGSSTSGIVIVRNAGGQLLAWVASDDAAWLEILPAVGRLGFDEEARVTLQASAKGLPPGSHRATVTIEAGGVSGSPAKVSVSFYVQRPEPEPSQERELPGREPSRPSARKPQPSVESTVRQSSPTGMKDGIGLRVGTLLPASGDAADYGPNLAFGVSYKHRILEAGIDLGSAEEANGYTSTPLDVRLDAVLGRKTGYLLAGGALALEFVKDSRDDSSYVNGVFGLDLGAGYYFAGGGVDVRVVYQVFLASENVPGRAAVTVGYRF